MKNVSEEHHKAYIRQLIYDNKIIDAIKYIGELTGMGLKESKELCEMF
jgi:ribosomal protein L7/L12